MNPRGVRSLVLLSRQRLAHDIPPRKSTGLEHVPHANGQHIRHKCHGYIADWPAPRRGCISRAITARPVETLPAGTFVCVGGHFGSERGTGSNTDYALSSPVTGADLVKRKNGTARIAGNKTRVVLIGPKALRGLAAPRCPVRRSRCSVSIRSTARLDAVAPPSGPRGAPASRPMSARIDCGMPVCRPRSVHLVRARLGHASPRDLRPGTRARGRATA